MCTSISFLGDNEWKPTKAEYFKSWKVLNNLIPNTKYQIRLVAMNKFGEHTYSKKFSVFTDPTYSEYR